MKLRTLLSTALLCATPAILLAQTSAEPARPTTPKAPKAARAVTAVTAVSPVVDAPVEVPPVPPSPPELYASQPPTPPAAPKAPTAPARLPSQSINVQIEVTLSDSKGSAKTVLLTVVDGEMGQNRTYSSVLPAGSASSQNFTFNADARPHLMSNAPNKVRLYLSAEATVPPAADGRVGSNHQISLKQSQTLMLTDGESVEIARAADPISDRVFTLSVKAKIQR